MVFAIADEGPAKEWVPRKPWPSVRGEFISFKVRGTKSLELVSWDARLGKVRVVVCRKIAERSELNGVASVRSQTGNGVLARLTFAGAARIIAP